MIGLLGGIETVWILEHACHTLFGPTVLQNSGDKNKGKITMGLYTINSQICVFSDGAVLYRNKLKQINHKITCIPS